MRRRLSIILTIIVLAMAGVIGYLTFPTIFGSIVVPLPESYQSIVKANAEKYGIDACFIAAFISVESNWNVRAGSHAGAKGLMQLMPPTARSVATRYGIPYSGTNDLFNPEINVALGTALLDYNFRAYGSVRNVAVAYNAGGGRVKLSDAALPRETRGYIVKIPRAYDLYKSVYPQFCTKGRPAGNNLGTGGPSTIRPTTPQEDFEDFSAGNLNPSINLNEFWRNWLPL